MFLSRRLAKKIEGLELSRATKSKRRPNWTEDEVMVLSELVKENKRVIEGKFGPGVTSIKRQEAWQKIANCLNASFPNHRRTKEEAEKKWKNIKCKTKKNYGAYKSQTAQTGGPAPVPLSPVSEAVVDVLGADNVSLTGIEGGINSSMMQILGLTSHDTSDHILSPEPVPEHSQSMEALLKEKVMLEIECLKLKRTYLSKRIEKC